MKTYEVMFIIAPNAADDEVDKIIAQMEVGVKTMHGEVISVEKMGKRKLAYRIARFEEGFYVLFNIKANGEVVKEFERRLRVIDSVIRYITVRVDKALKRVEKVKAIRLKKVRRKSPGTQPEAATPAI